MRTGACSVSLSSKGSGCRFLLDFSQRIVTSRLQILQSALQTVWSPRPLQPSLDPHCPRLSLSKLALLNHNIPHFVRQPPILLVVPPDFQLCLTIRVGNLLRPVGFFSLP